MALSDITRSEVAKAIEECDRLGRDLFLQRYGFRPARRYLLSHEGRQYDSKAVVGAAHGFLPGREPLAAKDFSGGAEHAVRLLKSLGYSMEEGGGRQAAPELAQNAASAALADATSAAVASAGLVDAVGRLKVNRSSGRPALYQPITLLWAIGRARRGESRLVSWRETEAAVGSLLERYGARGERPRPDYPVAALYRAGLWELRGHEGAVPSAHGDVGLRNWFADRQPLGGLPESVHELLRRSGETRLCVIEELLSRFFEDLDPGPLLTELGLYDDQVADDGPEPWLLDAARYERLCRNAERQDDRNGGRRVARVIRDPLRSAWARKAVLSRSGGRCENPGCAGQPDDVTDARNPILEVDHVVDLALGGRDHPSQMVALCPNCHAVKTRGRSREALRAVLLRVAAERHDAARDR
ncbi:HNH endonuclease [Streptomyces sp. NBC_00028]|uniref:HNH endonuclease signature motif containing protein n=1 Tax=Streptomyces sp. NBC_00028 TaxID=2975624 RepID=UPI00324CF0A3